MTTEPLQPSLFDPSEPIRKFDGQTYDRERDGIRLTGQLGRVFELMKDGKWRGLAEIRQNVPEASESGISARLRDFRKPQFGGHTVVKKNFGGGLWKYRLTVREKLSPA